MTKEVGLYISTEYTKQNLLVTKKTQSNPTYFEGNYDGPTTTSAGPPSVTRSPLTTHPTSIVTAYVSIPAASYLLYQFKHNTHTNVRIFAGRSATYASSGGDRNCRFQQT